MNSSRTIRRAALSRPRIERYGLTLAILNALKAAPLLVNGYAMVASTALTSIFGVIFWMVATHFYSQPEVGLGAALISSMMTVSYFGQINLSTVLNRYLPTADQSAGSLIVKAYIVAGFVSGGIALGFSLGIGDLSAPLDVLRNNSNVTIVFVLATILWTLFALQDAALSGLRLSIIIPFENTAYSVLKIALVIGFAFLVTFTIGGIFFAWILALVPIVLVVNFLIFRHLKKRKFPSSAAGTVDFAEIAKFLRWDYAGSLFQATALGLAPILISSVAGVEAYAPYHIAWTFAYSVYLLSRSMSVSLLAESATFPLRLRRLVADTVSHTLLLVSAAVAVLLVAAPYVLKLFGANYVAESTAILRILIISCMPWAVVTIFIAALRAQSKTLTVAMLQFTTLVVFSTSSFLLLPKYGALGVSYGWLIAQTIVLGGLVTIHVTQSQRGATTDFLLLFASSLANVIGEIRHWISRKYCMLRENQFAKPDELPNYIPDEFVLLSAPVSASDSTTLLLAGNKSASDGSRNRVCAVLKYSDTSSGIAALQRNTRILNELRSDVRLNGLKKWFPKVIETSQTENSFQMLETAVEGCDGRSLLRANSQTASAYAEVATCIFNMHERTSNRTKLEQFWATRWIDEPISVLVAAVKNRRNNRESLLGLDYLQRDLRGVLLGRKIALGRGHGDLSPGNIMLLPKDFQSSGVELSGFVDWENSKPDSPVAVDLFHLLLTMKMLVSGEELGQIVRNCILENDFDINDIFCAEPEGSPNWQQSLRDEDLSRAMLLLAWLHHIRANLIKSAHYSTNWFWLRSNLDRVLSAIAVQAR
ncbi:MAG: phosphotransferase [Roseibium sp.]